MYVWYTNSKLASLISIFGCVMIVIAITDRVWGLAIPGLGLTALGKYISVRKEQKKTMNTENTGEPRQTVRQDAAQTPTPPKKEIPAAGTKQAKITIAISGILVFINLFLGGINTGENTMTIYGRFVGYEMKSAFWALSVFILLVIVFNLCNLQKWSLIGSVGVYVFAIGISGEIFRIIKADMEFGEGAMSLNIFWWVFFASAIVFLAVAIKEGVLGIFEKYR
ncbi:MAG: hypothetical protein KH828_02935 [Clostridiales bacterium]|nr:hypothetical protein [Clostridiales bacterium]